MVGLAFTMGDPCPGRGKELVWLFWTCGGRSSMRGRNWEQSWWDFRVPCRVGDSWSRRAGGSSSEARAGRKYLEGITIYSAFSPQIFPKAIHENWDTTGWNFGFLNRFPPSCWIFPPSCWIFHRYSIDLFKSGGRSEDAKMPGWRLPRLMRSPMVRHLGIPHLKSAGSVPIVGYSIFFLDLINLMDIWWLVLSQDLFWY